jgi:hypothetical protein
VIGMVNDDELSENVPARVHAIDRGQRTLLTAGEQSRRIGATTSAQ